MDFRKLQQKMTIIQCGDIMVAASCERKNVERVESYYPATILVYVEKGILNIETNGKLYVFRTV